MKNLSISAAVVIFATLSLWPVNALADNAMPRGIVHKKTSHSYADLVKRLNVAVKKNKMGLVTRASATVGAKKVLKKKIPGNMVIGVYHPRFAVRMLKASIPAGIEAPLRFYVTENSDATASLSYKTPSSVFAPYKVKALNTMAAELDVIFAKIARDAIQ
ncbi:MAG: hypothetical protein CMM52_02400 [Rhodospirillaceae bacterium]|nr:hypothetical protein [Rhodospirillaceae bacterium]|tara:strand:- start:24149 stop:24628 length:480 start_codon:yes stop_codon:yes gene_type:complete